MSNYNFIKFYYQVLLSIDLIIVHYHLWWRVKRNAKDTSRNGHSTKRKRLVSLTFTADVTELEIYLTRKKNVNRLVHYHQLANHKKNYWMGQPPIPRHPFIRINIFCCPFSIVSLVFFELSRDEMSVEISVWQRSSQFILRWNQILPLQSSQFL